MHYDRDGNRVFGAETVPSGEDSISRIARADRDLAAAEEDWTRAANELRAMRFDLTHTQPNEEGGELVERTLSREGLHLLDQASRNEYRLRKLYEACRDRRAALVAEFDRAAQPLGSWSMECRWPDGACTCHEGGPHFAGNRPTFR